MPDRAPPQRLEDVQKGDTVWVFSYMGGPDQKTVKRVTKHLIILEDDKKYSRYYGTQDGDRWRHTRIAVGPDAERMKVERAADEIRGRAALELGIQREQLSQQIVQSKRAACDRAERALRELNEWTE